MPNISTEQKERLSILAKEMRKVASPVGSLHGWWDLIFDIEEYLEDGETILQLDADGFIAEAESYFAESNMPAPDR